MNFIEDQMKPVEWFKKDWGFIKKKASFAPGVSSAIKEYHKKEH